MDSPSDPQQLDSARLTYNNGAADFTPPTLAAMRQLQNQADDAMSDGTPVPQPSPPKPSTRGKGRGGRIARGKGKIAKPAAPKPVAGRGRRHKMYDSPKAQAAYERMIELKANYSSIAKAVKPAVQEIADRSINQLLQDPSIIQKVPEYQEIQSFLHQRLTDAKKTTDRQLEFGQAMAERVYEGQKEIVHREFQVRPTISQSQSLSIDPQ